MASSPVDRGLTGPISLAVGSLLLLASLSISDVWVNLAVVGAGFCFNAIAILLMFWPVNSQDSSDEDYGSIAEDGKISVTQAEPPLREFFPNELEAETIDWNALCNEIDRSRRQYELPTAPDGEDGPWLDKFAVCQDVARYVRDGGTIDVDRVIES